MGRLFLMSNGDWPIQQIRSQGKGATGWMVGGIGWYRKSFATPSHPKNGRVSIRFDGVYMNAEFWINGTKLGQHPYGYTTFEYDLTTSSSASTAITFSP